MRKSPIILLAAIATLMIPPAFAQNRVLSLDGDGDYVEVADSEALNNIDSQVTMEAWIKPTSFLNQWIPVIYKGDEQTPGLGNRSYTLWLNRDGYVHLAPQGQAKIESSSGSIKLNDWYHIAGIIDAKNGVMRIFINGVEVARGRLGQDMNLSALPLRIGGTREGSGFQSPFAGQMDEVRIWNIARTQEEIQATMYMSLSGKEQGLVGYWQFNDLGSPSARKVGDAHLVEAELPGPGELAIPAVLSGLITNESGRPIADAYVRMEQDGEEIAQAQTDKQGNYWITIPSSARGLYDLSATSGELGDWRLGIRLRGGESQKINLTLEKASIEGTIMMLDDITPHVAVPVQVIVGEKIIDGALTDENGKYRFINLRPGHYNVRCYIPGEYVYSEGAKAREPESQEARKPIILRVGRGKTLKNINFRFHQFKKGTWRHYDTSDGLASISVNDICLAPDGTMWFSTGSRDWIVGSGVSRYDGQEFVNFTTKDGLVHNAVKSIYCDQDGVIWFGTYYGISRYDGQEFVNFTTENGLLNNWVYAIHSTPDGVLWFGTRGGGVSRYDGQEFVNFTAEDGLVNNWVYAIHNTPDSALWFGTNGSGVSRYDGREFVSFTTEDGLAHSLVYAIQSTPDGVLWFGTGGGVSRYDGEEFVNFTMKDGLAHNSVWAIHRDSDGMMWFGTEGGVSRYDGEGFVNFTTEDGLMNNMVQAVYRSADGSLWFGSRYGGVSRYDERTFTRLTEDDGLVDNGVRAIHRTPDGVLWLGARGGVSRYDGKGFVNFTRENGLADDDVGVIHRDANGALWFGTGDLGISWGGGVSRYVPSAEQVGSVRFVNFTTGDGLAGNGVLDIHSAPDGALWFGTRNGVSRYDGTELVDVTTEIGLDAYRTTVSCIHSAADGVLWFGGYEDLLRYDGKELVNFTTQDGLVDNFVFAIHGDRDGALWFATYGGVSRYNGKEFLNFTTEDGLAGNLVRTIYAEPDGTLWFGGGGGVSGYDGVAWTSLGKRDGLAGNVVESIEQDPDGNFWIGTDKGLIHYNRSKTKPKVRIVSVRTDKDYTEDAYRGLSQQTIPPIRAGHRVTIGCSAIDFKTSPEKRQYQYRVREIDTNWRKPTRSVQFEWAPDKPGTYTFEVRAIDRDLNYSEPASLKLEIITPFYLRSIFLVPAIGFGTILLATMVILAMALTKRRRQVHAYQQLAVQELQDAREMQMSLLPEAAPAVAGMEIAGRSITANTVGGDFFDYLSLPDGKIGIAIADISGKGLRAAMNATMTNGMIHEVATIEVSCSSILSRLNAHLYPLMEKQMFTAFSLAILDPNSGVIQWTSAAQPLPLIKQGTGVSEAEGDGQLPLGMASDVEYSDYELRLQTGNTVIFYTDGIIEAENEAEEMYGTERLLDLVAGIEPETSAENVLEAILQDVSDFAGSAQQYDDMTVVVLKNV